jgi:basic membrane lipoprotein Med (substrate-binding protein (PBP1-ABC) superfamily)
VSGAVAYLTGFAAARMTKFVALRALFGAERPL